MTKDVTNIDRIIAKIDNDFNPDNSDWIPRVGAWVHDGLGLLNISMTKKVKEKFVVKDRIAYNKCEFKVVPMTAGSLTNIVVDSAAEVYVSQRNIDI